MSEHNEVSSIPLSKILEERVVTLEKLRESDEKFYNERDRRYAEVSNEKEKAIKIKEEADKVALDLAREIQKYKDEKANELRKQIESERGLYPTKAELKVEVERVNELIKPLAIYVTSQQGSISSEREARTQQNWSTDKLFLVVITLINVFFWVLEYIKK